MGIRDTGIIIIGRNEGERLRSCFNSISQIQSNKVYVDSGSTDDSIEMAKRYGIEIKELSPDLPFSAARARNEGLERLLELNPNINYVQFIDGDCSLVDGWLDKAANFLENHADVAVVCGRLREQFPDRSIYNWLCDAEWDMPAGESKACGGIAMFRVSAFIQEGGFRTDLIAGEEPELCIRLRKKGWKIWRLMEEMARHDAAITRFSQWWKRAQRGGYAFAEGAYLHGGSSERHWLKESLSIWFWAGLIPISMIFFALFKAELAALVFLLYPLQIIKIALTSHYTPKENLVRACFLIVGKFPELQGQLKFLIKFLMNNSSKLIEYK